MLKKIISAVSAVCVMAVSGVIPQPASAAGSQMRNLTTAEIVRDMGIGINHTVFFIGRHIFQPSAVIMKIHNDIHSGVKRPVYYLLYPFKICFAYGIIFRHKVRPRHRH